MKSLRLAAALAALLCVAGAKKPVIDLRIHAQGSESEAPSFAIPAMLLNGQPVFLQRMALITQSEVDAIYPFAAADGSQGVYLKLGPHGSRLLQQHTSTKKGEFLVVMLNGRMVSNLLIDRPIDDGILSIPRGLSADDIAVMETVFPVVGQEDKKKKR